MLKMGWMVKKCNFSFLTAVKWSNCILMVSLYILLLIYTNNETLCIIWKFDFSPRGVLGRIYALSTVLRCASDNVTRSNIFHQANLTYFYVSLYVETYKNCHDNNIWNWGLEFYVKIIRKTLIPLKPKASFPWAWHLKDRCNSDSCKKG